MEAAHHRVLAGSCSGSRAPVRGSPVGRHLRSPRAHPVSDRGQGERWQLAGGGKERPRSASWLLRLTATPPAPARLAGGSVHTARLPGRQITHAGTASLPWITQSPLAPAARWQRRVSGRSPGEPSVAPWSVSPSPPLVVLPAGHLRPPAAVLVRRGPTTGPTLSGHPLRGRLSRCSSEHKARGLLTQGPSRPSGGFGQFFRFATGGRPGRHSWRSVVRRTLRVAPGGRAPPPVPVARAGGSRPGPVAPVGGRPSPGCLRATPRLLPEAGGGGGGSTGGCEAGHRTLCEQRDRHPTCTRPGKTPTPIWT